MHWLFYYKQYCKRWLDHRLNDDVPMIADSNTVNDQHKTSYLNQGRTANIKL